MNLLILAGNVGGEPRFNTIQTANGPMSVLNFSLAVQTSKKDPQTGKYGTLWVDCSLWGTRADSLAQYIQKGSKLSITGEPGVETYQAQDGMKAKMTCRVSELTLQGSAQQAPAPQPAPQSNPQQQAPAQQGFRQPYNQPAHGKNPNGSAAPNYHQGTAQPQGYNQPQQPAPPIDFDSDIPF